MAFNRALLIALDFARLPGLAVSLRNRPLPPDLIELIRIAANCPEASQRADTSSRMPLAVIKPAVVFYLEQMLFFPGADPYRTLGVHRGASRDQLTLHRRWLMRWLHPDVNGGDRANALAARVLKACNELRLDGPGGSAPQSELPEKHLPQHGRPKAASVRVPWVPIPLTAPADTRVRLWRRMVGRVRAFLHGVTLLVVPNSVLWNRRQSGHDAE